MNYICSSYMWAGTNWVFEVLMMLLRRKVERVDITKLVTMIEAQGAEDVDKASSPRVINSHLPPRFLPKDLAQKKIKTMLCLRNPKDTAVSFFNHMRGMKMYNYGNGQWKKQNGMKEMERLVTFLEIDISDSLKRDILDMCGFEKMAAEKITKKEEWLFNENFRFFRKGEVGDWKNWFTLEQKEYFDSEWNTQIRADTIFQFKYTHNLENS
ncbi:sulfotransferase 1B1-like [Mya arenaria]|uniref:sulfotransferase 1B1-like n=1 Tax=Mya arenaria TaxID=6604 RepID=UPI0022DECB2E|nr:sulfotransferase 1B1-like [Mya arenaria]